MLPTRSRAPFIDAIGVSALALAGAGLLAGTPPVVCATTLLAAGLVRAAMLLRAGRVVAATVPRQVEVPVPTRARR